MDLGFGSSNQAVGTAAASALLRTAEMQEKAVEGEMARYDAMLDDASALERLRRQRLAELQGRQQRVRECRELGHGTYRDLGSVNTNDVAKEFFDICKKSQRVVVHFHRPTTRLCDVFHKHLTSLAEKHWETRFVSINVESCEASASSSSSTSANSGAAFLVERLGIVVMPTLLIVKDRQSVHQLRGFDELGNTPDFTTAVLETVLARYGAVDVSESTFDGGGDDGNDDDDEVSPRGVQSIRGSSSRQPFGKVHRPSRRRFGDDDEEEDF